MSCPEYQMFKMVSKPMWVLCFLTIGLSFCQITIKQKRLEVGLNLDLCLCLWFRSWNCVGRSIMSWSPCCCNGSDTTSSSLRRESSPQAMRRLRWVDLRLHTFTTEKQHHCNDNETKVRFIRSFSLIFRSCGVSFWSLRRPSFLQKRPTRIAPNTSSSHSRCVSSSAPIDLQSVSCPQIVWWSIFYCHVHVSLCLCIDVTETNSVFT